MGREFPLTPREVPHVATTHRRIVTAIPAPASIARLERLREHEPASMGGQPPVIWHEGDTFHIRELGYDRWNATQLVTGLMDDGATMVPVGQGYASLSAPTKDWLARIAAGKVRHGGNPVLRWMASNLVVTQDPAGNLKPDKAKSTERIDGHAAAITALSRLTAPHEPEPNAPGFTSYWEAEYQRRLAEMPGARA